MLTLPKNIEVDHVSGKLCFFMIGIPFSGYGLRDGKPSVRFRARIPGMGVHTDLPRGHLVSLTVPSG